MQLKKGDFLIILILAVALAGWLARDLLWPDSEDKKAIVEVNGQLYKTIPLNTTENNRLNISLPNNNFVDIVSANNVIYVEDASCPDKVCIKTGKISKTGQNIVCLPNKVVILIEGEKDQEYDDLSY
ncbi:MAG: NusG domain II-containing protein [Bacillota bacterium]